MNCRLAQIFTAQRSLMKRFTEIEAANGLLETPDVPVDLNCRFGQARLRNYGWRVVEEIAEAQTAWTQVHGEDQSPFQEEVADALHFLVELTILAGITPQSLLEPIPHKVNQDRLEALYGYVQAYWCSIGEDDTAWGWMNFIRNLGMTLNGLKYRPWKQKALPTDVMKFRANMSVTWVSFIGACSFSRITAEQLHASYFGKHQQNVQRQEAGV